MKKTILTRLFIAIVIFTGFSVMAQAADNTVLTEVVIHEHGSYEHVLQDASLEDADIEFERETKEFESAQLRNIIKDKRFTGRKIKIPIS